MECVGSMREKEMSLFSFPQNLPITPLDIVIIGVSTDITS
jgi:hypothetical protein